MSSPWFQHSSSLSRISADRDVWVLNAYLLFIFTWCSLVRIWRITELSTETFITTKVGSCFSKELKLSPGQPLTTHVKPPVACFTLDAVRGAISPTKTARQKRRPFGRHNFTLFSKRLKFHNSSIKNTERIILADKTSVYMGMHKQWYL